MELKVVMLLLAGAAAGDQAPLEPSKEAATTTPAAPKEKLLEAPRRVTLKLSSAQAEKKGWAGPRSGAIKLRTPPEPVPLSVFVQPDGRIVYRHGRLPETSVSERKPVEVPQ